MHVGQRLLCRSVFIIRLDFLFLNDIAILINANCTRFSQFEDFQMKWAFETLHRYRKKFCMFNDDIQVNKSCTLVLLHSFALENIFWKCWIAGNCWSCFGRTSWNCEGTRSAFDRLCKPKDSCCWSREVRHNQASKMPFQNVPAKLVWMFSDTGLSLTWLQCRAWCF